MKSKRFSDVDYEESEVGIKRTYIGRLVYLDFNPDCYDEFNAVMYYTAESARELAACLIKAAEEAESK